MRRKNNHEITKIANGKDKRGAGMFFLSVASGRDCLKRDARLLLPGFQGVSPEVQNTPKGWGLGGLKRSYEIASRVSLGFLQKISEVGYYKDLTNDPQV